MLGKLWGLALVFLLSVSASLGFNLFFHYVVGQSNRVVVNVDTGLSYFGVQEAINAIETLDGHRVEVGFGVFEENVVVNKSISLMGLSSDTSIIDGMAGLVVVDVLCEGVEIRNLGIRNGVVCLQLDEADNCKIVDNVLYDGSYGLRLRNSRNSFVTGNRVSGFSYFGVELESSGNSTLRGNWLSQNQYNFGVDGSSLSDFVNDIDDSNFVNGKPIRYLLNQRNLTVDSSTYGDIGYLGFVNSSHVVVRNLEVQNNVQGVLFAFVTDSSAVDVGVNRNWNGVYVACSRNVSVSGVKANQNFDYGIKLFNSSGSRVIRNDADDNGWASIGLFWSSSSVVEGNLADHGTYGLHIVYTNSSVIEGNVAEYRPNGYSIALYYSHQNLIFRNVFANGLLFAEKGDSSTFVPSNYWDNRAEGNFWTSYYGLDEDQDGIGDTPRNVGQNNVDRYPLMGRFLKFDVVAHGKVYGIDVVSNSSVSGLEFEINSHRISFAATGEDGTSGFSRVAIPRNLVDTLRTDDVAFLVNGKEPISHRKWSDESYVYWYLSYPNILAKTWISEFFIFIALILLMIVLVFLVLLKRRRTWN